MTSTCLQVVLYSQIQPLTQYAAFSFLKPTTLLLNKWIVREGEWFLILSLFPESCTCSSLYNSFFPSLLQWMFFTEGPFNYFALNRPVISSHLGLFKTRSCSSLPVKHCQSAALRLTMAKMDGRNSVTRWRRAGPDCILRKADCTK